MLVHVIDVESGNLQSLTNAIEFLGYSVQLITSPSDPAFHSAQRLILPGVGNYGHFVNQVRSRGFVEPILDYINSGRSLMGICVGLQTLFSGSEESPECQGLGLVDYRLKKFDDSSKTVPQIGWNCVTKAGPYGLDPNERYYFVHSFAGVVSSENDIKDWQVSLAKYGDETFVAAVSKENVFATQFHPEKSGKAGLAVIDNFLKQNKAIVETEAKAASDYSNNGLTRRVIACLDVRTNDQGDLVVTKGDQYDVREKDDNTVRNLGKPVEMAEKYYKQGADEVTFLNIMSFKNSPVADTPMLDVLKLAAKTVFVPLTVGGGIKDTVDPDGTVIPALKVASLYFRAGADKVSIGTDAVYAAEQYYANGNKGDGTSPIETISRAYGAQAVVISVDPKRVYVSDPSETKNKTFKTEFLGPHGEQYVWYQCTIKGGRESRDIGVWELTRACQALGAGEILLNCIDKDGSNSGYDLELVRHVKEAVSIPVIASSGAGNPQHFEEVFKNTTCDAALGAGMFHRGEFTVGDVKEYLAQKGMQVRV